MANAKKVERYGELCLCPECGSLFIKVKFQGFEVELKHCGWCGCELDWTKESKMYDTEGNLFNG